MNTVFKYQLDPPGHDSAVKLPAHARVLHADCQGDRICLWAMVNPSFALVGRVFRVMATGEAMDPALHYEHISTLLVGQFVWHVFELHPQYDGT